VRLRFIQLLHFWRILADQSGARPHGAIRSDPRVIGAVPLSPAVLLRGLGPRIGGLNAEYRSQASAPVSASILGGNAARREKLSPRLRIAGPGL
jgi:hypothetical protein